MANNIIVPVPTELKTIKSTLIFGLTKRQAIGFGLAIAVVVPTFLLLKEFDITFAMYASFASGSPIVFGTLYKKDKLHSEKIIKNKLEHKLLFREKRLYKISLKNREIAIARGFISNDEKKNVSSSNKTDS